MLFHAGQLIARLSVLHHRLSATTLPQSTSHRASYAPQQPVRRVDHASSTLSDCSTPTTEAPIPSSSGSTVTEEVVPSTTGSTHTIDEVSPSLSGSSSATEGATSATSSEMRLERIKEQRKRARESLVHQAERMVK